MTYILSIAPEEMTGSSKGVTAAKVRSRKYIRNKGIGGSVRTSTNPQRNPFSRSSPRAGNLTNAQILAWNALALSQAGKRILAPLPSSPVPTSTYV